MTRIRYSDLTDEELNRFRSRIEGGPGCWPWNGERNNQGYGRFRVYRGPKTVRLLAHRLSYYLATGIDPGRSVVRHSCDTPICCNPQHLTLGTQADNVRDAAERGRANLAGLFQQIADREAAGMARLVAGEKECCDCRQVKPLAEFRQELRNLDGRDGRCRECQVARERAKRRAA